MNRITMNELNMAIDYMNEIAGTPKKPYTQGKDGRLSANVNCYYLSQAYGGYSLHQMANNSGGCRDVFYCGHTTKRKLHGLIHAWIRGRESNAA